MKRKITYSVYDMFIEIVIDNTYVLIENRIIKQMIKQ